jgi:hypothetical protein
MPRFGRAQFLFWCAIAAAACAGTKAQPTNPAGSAGAGGTSMTGTGGSLGGQGGGGLISIAGSTGSGGTGGACVPSATCTPPGGQYCGIIGNGCPGQQLDCGMTCPGDWTCDKNQCVGGASCAALSCGNYCGDIGDGCGRKLTCATCAAGKECRGGICVDPGCVPITCNGPNNTRYCGMIGDGCGGTLDCMTCPNGGTCGGPGYDPNVCNDPTCVKVSCTPTGGQYCGVIGNSCGGTQDCGACTNGMACPTSGTSAHVCPGSMVTVQPTCTGATKTTISGSVYDPAGKVPLYNIAVYIPSTNLDPVAEGVSCDKCNGMVSGHPIASALTDATGHFTMTIEPVPTTTNVPFVMQVGKWRRQVTIPSIKTCQDNPITDVNLTRLPKSTAEGNLPRIAVTTGGSDALECFLREIGIADSEFTTDAGSGRVHLYVGGDMAMGKGQGANSFTAALGGATLRDAQTLWKDANKMLGYDIIVHSCEGGQYPNAKQPYIANVKRYADAGGRLFNSHLHFYWLRSGPAPWPTTAGYLGTLDDLDPNKIGVSATIDTSFTKGAAFGTWLMSTGATATAGQLMLYGSQHSVETTTPPTAQRWLYLPAAGSIKQSIQYLTIPTPVEAAAGAQCGKVVLTDIHVKEGPPTSGSKDDSDPTKPFPSACKVTGLSGQAKALEFLFFDLSSCIEPPGTMPQPPIVPPPGTTTGPPPPNSTPPAVPPPPPPPPPPNPG